MSWFCMLHGIIYFQPPIKDNWGGLEKRTLELEKKLEEFYSRNTNFQLTTLLKCISFCWSEIDSSHPLYRIYLYESLLRLAMTHIVMNDLTTVSDSLYFLLCQFKNVHIFYSSLNSFELIYAFVLLWIWGKTMVRGCIAAYLDNT